MSWRVSGVSRISDPCSGLRAKGRRFGVGRCLAADCSRSGPGGRGARLRQLRTGCLRQALTYCTCEPSAQASRHGTRVSAGAPWRAGASCSAMRPSSGAAVASRRLAGQAPRGWRQRPRPRRRRRKRRDWRQRRRRRRRRRGRRGLRQRRTALTCYECPCSRSAAGVHPRDTPPRAILVGNSTGRLKADEVKSC